METHSVALERPTAEIKQTFVESVDIGSVHEIAHRDSRGGSRRNRRSTEESLLQSVQRQHNDNPYNIALPYII